MLFFLNVFFFFSFYADHRDLHSFPTRRSSDLTNFKDLRHNLTINTISAGLVAAIFGCTGPALIIIGGATSGRLTYTQTISWIFATYFFSGLLGIFLALRHRQPISGAHSIAGAVLVVGSLSH